MDITSLNQIVLSLNYVVIYTIRNWNSELSLNNRICSKSKTTRMKKKGRDYTD